MAFLTILHCNCMCILAASKLFPWSEWIPLHTPNVQKSFHTSTFATVCAVWSLVRTAIIHLLYTSINTSSFSNPWDFLRTVKSMAIHFLRFDALIVPFHCEQLVAVFLKLHISHILDNRSYISLYILYQKYLCRIILNTLLIPWFPFL